MRRVTAFFTAQRAAVPAKPLAFLCAIALAAALAPGALWGQSLTLLCEDDPPLQFVDINGRLTGLTVEVVREIQKRVGSTEEIKIVPWARGYDAALAGPNIVLFSMARTAERERLFNWVGPVMESVYGFYAKSSSRLSVDSIEEAKRVGRIGVYANDARDLILTGLGFTNLDRATDNVTNVKKLMAGRIDLYAGSSTQIASDARAAGFSPSELKEVFPFQRIRLYVTLSQGTDPNTVAAWSKAFASMSADGTFKRIFAAYYPELRPPSSAP